MMIQREISQVAVVVVVFVNIVFPYEITVATCNLWNVMFNWNVRKYRIAQMIQEAEPDVIAFQEVRFHADGSRNQIMELQELLPGYRWKLFKEAHTVEKPKGAHWQGWEKEGIGILSKRPITLFSTPILPKISGPDTNSRVLVLAKIFISPDISVQLAALHLSYDRHQQCGNSKSVIELLREQESPSIRSYSIALGDFNTYNDFDWPVQLFKSPNQETLRKCLITDWDAVGGTSWKDVWETVGHSDGGLTFSNMPTPGYESRPDRILASSHLKSVMVFLKGNGSIYKAHYYQNIVTERLKTVVHSAYLSWYGVTGYPCFQDCGPRGYCRCGVCVRGDHPASSTCQLPNCTECSSEIFFVIVVFVVVTLFIFIHLFYSLLCLLISAADFRGEAVYAILGCNCCLCNPENFKPPNFNSRKFRLFRRLRKWPLFRIPPYILMATSLLLSVLLLTLGSWIFMPTLATVYSIMHEEFYPSDHLMLVAKLQTT